MNRRSEIATILAIAMSASTFAAFGQVFQLWSGTTTPSDPNSIPFAAGVTHVTLLDGSEHTHHFLHGAAIINYDGAFYANWANSPTNENYPDETLQGRTFTNASDTGTWSAVELIGSDLPGDDRRSHAAYLEHQGQLWTFAARFGVGDPGVRFDGLRAEAFVLNETNDQWESRGVVMTNCWPYEEPVRMTNGNFIVGGQDKDGLPVVAISHGDDLTRWDSVLIPYQSALAPRFAETTVWAEGTNVTAVIRGGEGVAWVATSADGGSTWDEARPSNLPMPRAKAYLGKLSTGQLYLISNLSNRNTLCVSAGRPGESTLSAMWRIRHGSSSPVPEIPGFAKAPQWSYPYGYEHDGKLYVVYSIGKEDCGLSVIPVTSLYLAPPEPPTPPADTNLVAVYRFEGNTQDSSGNLNHATPNGTGFGYSASVPTAIAGRSAQSCDLTGDSGSDFASLPTDFNGAATNTGASVSLWVQTASPVDQDYVFSVGNSADNTPIYGIQGDPDDNARMRFFYRNDAGDSDSATGTASVFGTGWHHLVLTHDGTTARVYADGDPTPDLSLTVPAGALTADLNALGALYRNNTGLYMDGQIDEVAIYTRVLGTNEIAALYGGTDPTNLVATTNAPTPASDTVAYWQLDEASGNLVDVVGGNDFPAGSGLAHAEAALVSPVPNPDATAGSANSGSIDFSGTSDAPRLTGTANDPFELLDTRSFTFEGWVRHNISDGSQDGIEQFAGDRHGSAYTGWAMWINGGKVQIYFDMGSPRVYVKSTTRIDDGNPHHFAAVWDHLNLEFRLYVDGLEEGTMEGEVAELGNSANYNQSDAPFALGARRTSGGYNASALNGRLDELRFSNVALTPSEFLVAPPPAGAVVLIR